MNKAYGIPLPRGFCSPLITMFALILASLGILACIVPAVRAMRVSPMNALPHE